MKRLIFTILIAVATVSLLRAQEPTSPEDTLTFGSQDSLSTASDASLLPAIKELPAPTFYADLNADDRHSSF